MSQSGLSSIKQSKIATEMPVINEPLTQHSCLRDSCSCFRIGSAMKSVPESVSNLLREIHRLNHRKSWFNRSRCDQQMASLLNTLAGSAPPSLLLDICCFLLSSSETVKRAARSAVRQLVDKATIPELLSLNESRWWSFGRDDQLNPKQLLLQVAGDTHECIEADRIPLLGILSFHRSGFVRQEALRQLAQYSSGDELPFLLLRLNDWVEPIAGDARKAVARRIHDVALPQWTRCLSLLPSLMGATRRNHADIVSSLFQLLCEPRHDNQLREILANSSRDIRRIVAQYALKRPGEHQDRVARDGLHSQDAIVRMWSFSYLQTISQRDSLPHVLVQQRKDPYFPIRREAYRAQADCFPDTADETWKIALLDRSRSIRELAIFSLGKLGFDRQQVAETYRRRLHEKPEDISALRGLAETGGPTDVSFFQALLEHPIPSRRVLAIDGLLRALGEQAIPLVSPLLLDDSRSVVRTARTVMSRYPHLLDAGAIFDSAIKARQLYTRQNAVRLLSELGKWRSLPWLLQVAMDADEETGKFAEQMLTEWLSAPRANKNFSRPTPQEIHDIDALVQQADGRVSRASLMLISASLKIFRSGNFR